MAPLTLQVFSHRVLSAFSKVSTRFISCPMTGFTASTASTSHELVRTSDGTQLAIQPVFVDHFLIRGAPVAAVRASVRSLRAKLSMRWQAEPIEDFAAVSARQLHIVAASIVLQQLIQSHFAFGHDYTCTGS